MSLIDTGTLYNELKETSLDAIADRLKGLETMKPDYNRLAESILTSLEKRLDMELKKPKKVKDKESYESYFRSLAETLEDALQDKPFTGFKVGDEIRMNARANEKYHITVEGSEGKIVEDHGRGEFGVRFTKLGKREGVQENYRIEERYMEPLNLPKRIRISEGFKVGDEIKLVKNLGPRGGLGENKYYYNGTTSTIPLGTRGIIRYIKTENIGIETEEGVSWSCHPDELEPAFNTEKSKIEATKFENDELRSIIEEEKHRAEWQSGFSEYELRRQQTVNQGISQMKKAGFSKGQITYFLRKN